MLSWSSTRPRSGRCCRTDRYRPIPGAGSRLPRPSLLFTISVGDTRRTQAHCMLGTCSWARHQARRPVADPGLTEVVGQLSQLCDRRVSDMTGHANSRAGGMLLVSFGAVDRRVPIRHSDLRTCRNLGARSRRRGRGFCAVVLRGALPDCRKRPLRRLGVRSRRSGRCGRSGRCL
jgi:hypothetical protein